jgi:hypothetical protein
MPLLSADIMQTGELEKTAVAWESRNQSPWRIDHTNTAKMRSRCRKILES